MNLLALILDDARKRTDAEELYRTILSLMTKVWGVENKNTLTTMHSLAGVLCRLEKYNQAEEDLKETL